MPLPLAGEDITAALLRNLLGALLDGSVSGSHSVLTSQTTTSVPFVDLATVGPTITITSTGTKAIVWWAFEGSSGAVNGAIFSSVAVSGATTIAASNDSQCGADTNFFAGTGFQIFTINPGSNTYTMKYRVNANTGTFQRRRMFVLAP